MRLAVRDDGPVGCDASARKQLGQILPESQVALAIHQLEPVQMYCARDVTAARGDDFATFVFFARARIPTNEARIAEMVQHLFGSDERRGADRQASRSRGRSAFVALYRESVGTPRVNAAIEVEPAFDSDGIECPDETSCPPTTFVVVCHVRCPILVAEIREQAFEAFARRQQSRRGSLSADEIARQYVE